jgi:hypothetical protein
MWPMDLSVRPPKMQMRSAMGFGHGKKLLGMLIEQQMMTDENGSVIVGRI